MKNILKITMLIFMLSFTACQDDGNEKSKKELKTDTLTSTSWGHAQVVHSDGDLSDQYTDFAIVFTPNASGEFDGTFVVSHGGYAFAENNGKWRFNDELDQIIFDSDKEMNIQLEEGHLQLDFTVAAPGGKLVGVSGHFTFDLQPL